jgi:mono/diheme cytochrome c family protein
MLLKGRSALFAVVVGGWVAVSLSSVHTSARQTPLASPSAASTASPALRGVLDKYCITCHNQRMRTGGLALDDVDVARPAAHADVWERVIVKLRAKSMPPAGMPRPDASTYDAAAGFLEAELDRAWAANPNPGRISAVHRLNRVEYTNAIRDLFALDVDVTSPTCYRSRRRTSSAISRWHAR